MIDVRGAKASPCTRAERADGTNDWTCPSGRDRSAFRRLRPASGSQFDTEWSRAMLAGRVCGLPANAERSRPAYRRGVGRGLCRASPRVVRGGGSGADPSSRRSAAWGVPIANLAFSRSPHSMPGRSRLHARRSAAAGVGAVLCSLCVASCGGTGLAQPPITLMLPRRPSHRQRTSRMLRRFLHCGAARLARGHPVAMRRTMPRSSRSALARFTPSWGLRPPRPRRVASSTCSRTASGGPMASGRTRSCLRSVHVTRTRSPLKAGRSMVTTRLTGQSKTGMPCRNSTCRAHPGGTTTPQAPY